MCASQLPLLSLRAQAEVCSHRTSNVPSPTHHAYRLEFCLSSMALALLSQTEFSTDVAGVWQVSLLIDLWDCPSNSRTRSAPGLMFNMLNNDAVSSRDGLLQVHPRRHDAHRFPYRTR